LAVRSDGTVWGWGDNRLLQLHLPDTVSNASTPTRIPDISGATAVSTSIGLSAVLRNDGTVLSWGYTVKNGSVVDGFGAVPGFTGIAAVSAGGAHIVALRADGTVWTWGSNSMGQLGDGTTTDRSTAVAVPGLGDVIAVSAGSSYTLALKRDGTIWRWGA